MISSSQSVPGRMEERTGMGVLQSWSHVGEMAPVDLSSAIIKQLGWRGGQRDRRVSSLLLS